MSTLAPIADINLGGAYVRFKWAALFDHLVGALLEKPRDVDT
jgi:hypothetical protein